ncbi:MAG TPA: M4 family metallopeptidase [Candidatus Hydrogenedentes bacterium]|nr:M4 family metallopeptidase [Candidatus Hydrogenedentota bacterium]
MARGIIERGYFCLFTTVFLIAAGVLIASKAGAQTNTPASAVDNLNQAVTALITASVGGSETPRVVRAQDGVVRFAGSPPGGVFWVKGAGSTPESAAKAFLQEHAKAFGVSAATTFNVMRVKQDTIRSYVRMQQYIDGIPVFAGQTIVQVSDSGGVECVMSDISRSTGGFSLSAVMDENTAVDVAMVTGINLYGAHALSTVEDPELMVFSPCVLNMKGSDRLVWRVVIEATDGALIKELVLVDAENGSIPLHYTLIPTAKNRQIYDSVNTAADPGTLVRSEGQGECGITDADQAYDFYGDTYDYYMNEHGRDSIDGSGYTLSATVRYCYPGEGCPWDNAMWDGTRMYFGQGYAAADDVVAHELTHGVTQYESNLVYSGQSGAINESFSDIWGEFVDLTNGRGTDTTEVRWLTGEDLPIGALRSMSNPPAYGCPDSMCSSYWYSGTDDEGGVHTNSGVGNKLCYLLTDGDVFNDETVTGMGISQVADLFYEVQTNLLTSGADYADLSNALDQAAINLSLGQTQRDTIAAACRAVKITPGSSCENQGNCTGVLSFTQSNDASLITWGNSVACVYDGDSGIHTDNSYLRRFDLTEYGITNSFDVTCVEFGVDSCTGGPQPITINLYTIPKGMDFLIENLSLIGSVTDPAFPDISLALVGRTVNGTVTDPSTLDLAVEIFTPDGQASNYSFFIGSNAAGETASSYIAAAGCDISQPVPLSSLGFPDMHLVITVFGNLTGSEGEIEGQAEGEGSPSEGSTEEGEAEGQAEGYAEGVSEGQAEGEGQVEGEGSPSEGSTEEGEAEGQAEGMTEGQEEGEGTMEGEGSTEGQEENETCPPSAIFSQPPIESTESWNALTSSADTNFYAAERFSGLSQPVRLVKWWGLNLYYDGSVWNNCTMGANSVLVTIYEDNAGIPGTEVSSATITPEKTDTGLLYNDYPLYRYAAELPFDISIAEGWISFKSAGDPSCWLLWMNSGLGDTNCVQWQQTSYVYQAHDLSLCMEPKESEGEGILEGEGAMEGEGSPSEGSTEEGETEGMTEGYAEGVIEGAVEGEGSPSEGSLEEGEAEGFAEGIYEGAIEGEGAVEGEGEIEGEGEVQNECPSGVPADGGFEAGAGSGYWTEESTNYGTPLCDTSCNPIAYSGSWYCWFGGIEDIVEDGAITQTITIPVSTYAKLNFYMVMGATGLAGYMQVLVDGNVLFQVTEADVDSYLDYTQVSVDLAAYANGNSHTLRLQSHQNAGSGILNFFVDALCLELESDEGEDSEGSTEEGETEGQSEGVSEGDVEGEGAIESEGSPEEGALEGEGEVNDGIHSADPNGDHTISLSELLRIIQFFNSNGFHCQAGSEDGYAPGPGDTACAPHDSDYNAQDWHISLSELLRIIQFFNSGGYHYCPGEDTEDGYCPGLA